LSFSDFKKFFQEKIFEKKKTENFDEKKFREKNLRKKFKMENQRKKLESRKFFEKKLGNREPSREKNFAVEKFCKKILRQKKLKPGELRRASPAGDGPAGGAPPRRRWPAPQRLPPPATRLPSQWRARRPTHRHSIPLRARHRPTAPSRGWLAAVPTRFRLRLAVPPP